MAADSQLGLSDYLMILRRRAVLMSATFILVFGLAAIIAVVLPPLYRSTGTILVESQQIPMNLVPSTITSYADERIQIIRQRVMTRENLLRISERYRLFDQHGSSLTASEKIAAMRSDISIEPISADIGGGRRGAATIAFRLSYEHRSPEVAYKVANELVTLFLSENARVRTERASETTQFLAREADKLKVELEALENQVAAYKQEYGNALPEHLELHMSMLQRTELELRNTERDLRSAQEDRRFLELELAAIQAGAQSSTEVIAAPGADLEQLKAQYATLALRYTDRHPDVRALKLRIEAMEDGEQSGQAYLMGSGTTDVKQAQILAKVEASNTRSASLQQQHAALRARIAELEKQIIQTPQVERALYTLMRDHENARRKFEEVRAKQIDAQMAESLEEENKAERFSLLESPLPPDSPIKPDRKKLILMGFMLAAGTSGGMAFLLEMLNQRVRGPRALAQILRQPPLAMIPYISTKAEIKRRKRRLWLAAGCFLVLVSILIALMHFFYMPLDLLMLKVVARFG
jgi:polysaccharide chain length determinant protein (PEP-CTERM system associated)